VERRARVPKNRGGKVEGERERREEAGKEAREYCGPTFSFILLYLLVEDLGD
jgi:hypothetical protein